MTRRARRGPGPRTRRATFRHRGPAGPPRRAVGIAAVPAPVLEDAVPLPGDVWQRPAAPLGTGAYRCRCWMCKQAGRRPSARRRAWRHAAGWSVLCGGWALFTAVIAVQGWRMLGPASLCLPLVMGAPLVCLVAVAVVDVREQVNGPRELGI